MAGQPPHDWAWNPPYPAHGGDSHGGGGHNPANQPINYQERDGYFEGGLQTGIEGDVNYRLNLGIDPKLVDFAKNTYENSPYANRDYNTQYGRAKAHQRDLNRNELSGVRLDKMLGSDSPLMQRARMQANAGSAGRGLMNSSIAQGAAMGAMIDRAQPFAMQESGAYTNQLDKNLAAKNQASLTNAQQRTQAGLADTNALAARDRQLLAAELGGRQDVLRHTLGMETREDTQQFQESQNELNRIWTSGENAMNRTLDWGKSYMNALTSKGMSQQQAEANVIAQIMSNPNLTPTQQQQALQNFRDTFGDQFGEAWQLPGIPNPFGETAPYPGGGSGDPNLGGGGGPGSGDPGGGGGGEGGGGGGGGGSQPQFPWWDPRSQFGNNNIASNTNMYTMSNSPFSFTTPAMNPAFTAGNQQTGQSYTSAYNDSMNMVNSSTPPV